MYSNFLYAFSEGFKLIGRFHRQDQSIEIADLDQIDMGWTDYDPKRGASDKVLTMLCDSLYDRLLLQELGV